MVETRVSWSMYRGWLTPSRDIKEKTPAFIKQEVGWLPALYFQHHTLRRLVCNRHSLTPPYVSKTNTEPSTEWVSQKYRWNVWINEVQNKSIWLQSQIQREWLFHFLEIAKYGNCESQSMLLTNIRKQSCNNFTSWLGNQLWIKSHQGALWGSHSKCVKMHCRL